MGTTEFMDSPVNDLTSSELAKSLQSNKPKPTPPNPRPRKKSRTSFPSLSSLPSPSYNNSTLGGGQSGTLSPPYGLDPATLSNYMNATPGMDVNTMAMVNAPMTAGSTNEFNDIAFYQDPLVSPTQPLASMSLAGAAMSPTDALFHRGPMLAQTGRGSSSNAGSGSSLGISNPMQRSFSNDLPPGTIFPSLMHHSQLYAMAAGVNGSIGLGSQFANYSSISTSNPMSVSASGGGGGGGTSGTSSSTILRVCTDCGSTESPEWRKGPAGPKTLCNACGLRWAKKVRKDMEEQKQQQYPQLQSPK